MSFSKGKFTKAEVKAYPLLLELEVGLSGVAIDEDYKGLHGVITEIRYGDDKETENDCIVEIIMDFEEPSHGTLESLYPHLNGTGIDQLIMDEETVGIFFEEGSPALTLEGKIVCPECNVALNTVTETQYDDIIWVFVGGKYEKSNGGSSDGKKCPECGTYVEADESILGY